jgi:hypothetical protein
MKNIRLIVWIYLLILLLVFTGLFYKAGYINTGLIDPDVSAQFAAIIGGLTAPLVIYLLLETYQSQKEELKETKAIARQQADIMAAQQFESAFFSMLSRHLEIITSLEGEFPFLEGSYKHKGRAYLKKAVEDMRKSLQGTGGPMISEFTIDHSKGIIIEQKYEMGNPPISSVETDKYKTNRHSTFSINRKKEKTHTHSLEEYLKQMSEKYNDFYFHHQSFLGHYFRYIASMVSFIKDNHQHYENQKERYSQERKYIKLIQAQMSNDELGLIFYFGLSKNGRTANEAPSLWLLLDKYSLLEEINVSVLRAPWHTQFYPQTWFKAHGERNTVYSKYPFSDS